MNISGVIVYASLKQAESVRNKLTAFSGVEVHAIEDGKLVVTVVNKNVNALADQVMLFQDIEGVMSVAMVYQHNEDDESLASEEVLLEEQQLCVGNTCNEHVSEEALP